MVSPVRLPPGWARLATGLTSTGLAREAGAENPSQRVPIWYTLGDGCAADASGDRRRPRVACLMVASSSDILY
jgi:hypothetical protein